jgi:hypothetical protein
VEVEMRRFLVYSTFVLAAACGGQGDEREVQFGLAAQEHEASIGKAPTLERVLVEFAIHLRRGMNRQHTDNIYLDPSMVMEGMELVLDGLPTAMGVVVPTVRTSKGIRPVYLIVLMKYESGAKPHLRVSAFPCKKGEVVYFTQIEAWGSLQELPVGGPQVETFVAPDDGESVCTEARARIAQIAAARF